jgi:predicted anti-sigma-YlaC factor YlaD
MGRSCDEFRNDIKAELAGELKAEERLELTAHLDECAGCRNERELLKGVLGELKQVAEEEVPHHFFVYEEIRPSFWNLFRQMSWAPKGALAAACLILLMLPMLALSRFQVTVGDQTLSFGFGAAPAKQIDPEELKAELIVAVTAAAQEENKRLAQTLREQWETAIVASSREQKGTVQTLLADLDTRLRKQMLAQNTNLQASVDTTVREMYRLLRIQHADDLNAVRRELNRSASFNRVQANQSNLIMATLRDMADARNR